MRYIKLNGGINKFIFYILLPMIFYLILQILSGIFIEKWSD